jgi:hypothetical protein
MFKEHFVRLSSYLFITFQDFEDFTSSAKTRKTLLDLGPEDIIILSLHITSIISLV